MDIYTYNFSKSISKILGIRFIEIPELSDQQLDRIPLDAKLIGPNDKNVPAYPIMKGKNHPFFGKKHTEAAKKLMSLKKAGIKRKPLSEEHKNKLRKKRPHVGVNISNGKAFDWIIISKETGKEFPIKNLNQFCRDNGLSPGNLYKTLTGEIHYHKGYAIKHD